MREIISSSGTCKVSSKMLLKTTYRLRWCILFSRILTKANNFLSPQEDKDKINSSKDIILMVIRSIAFSKVNYNRENIKITNQKVWKAKSIF